MKIEEGQAARRRAKARGEMGWPRFLSLKYECVDQPALPAGLEIRNNRAGSDARTV
ncbi:hypothetical protein ACP3P8_02865 [Pseudomonas aeruginosa]